jgi:hypothetical protein
MDSLHGIGENVLVENHTTNVEENISEKNGAL